MKRLRYLPALCVFLSGYLPLVLVLIVLDFDWVRFEPRSPVLLFGVLLVALGSALFTSLHLRYAGYRNDVRLKLVDVEERSGDLLAYGIPYIAGFAGVNVSNAGQLAALAIVIWLIFDFTYRTRSVVMNPYLVWLRYRAYSARVEYAGGKTESVVILSSSPLRGGDSFDFCLISPSCYLRCEPRRTQNNAPSTTETETIRPPERSTTRLSDQESRPPQRHAGGALSG